MNTLKSNGLKIKNGKIVADNSNKAATVAFLQTLRAAADDAEKKSLACPRYKAKIYMQNARAARRDADRIEKTIL